MVTMLRILKTLIFIYVPYDAQFDYLSLQTYYCVGNKEFTIQGIYADQVFSYFEFSVVAKDTTKAWTDEVLRFLFHNDCKLQIAFTDIIIDLDNYENPITQYLNTIFIQLWKGLKRFEEQPAEYDYYSKVYIRAELKKTVIKRKYQKFMEFYADASSLLIAVFDILVVIFNYVDTFYAHHSLAKSIFFFKELEEKENFNVMKKADIIQELISITELQKKNSENSPIEIISKNSKIMKNFPPKKKETERQEVLESREDDQKEIQIYNSRNNNNNRPSDSKQTKTSSYMKGRSNEENKDYNRNYRRNQYNEKYSGEESDENYPRYKVNQMRRNKNNSTNLNFKYEEKNDIEFNDSIGTNMDDDYSSNTERPKRKKKLRVENDFNILEIIITQIFKCCMTKSMRLKNDANEKANEVLFKKMDINAYVRNSILFDVMNQTMIDHNKRTILNFLSRPVISVNKKTKNEFNEFYRNYKEKDFNKYYDNIQELVQKQKKDPREEMLLTISNEHLKSFVY